MTSANDIVNVPMTRRQAERLYDVLTVGAERGYGVNGLRARLRDALSASGITYDWDTIKANVLRRVAAKAREAQSGCSERPMKLDSAPESDESVTKQREEA